MIELEKLNEYRFYKLESKFPSRCYNIVENAYFKVGHHDPTRVCNGLLNLHMVDGSINMRCPHVDCNKEYEIPRICSACGRVTTFEDVTCDTCEPRVIDIATWYIAIAEANKAIKKVNRAFKQNLILEDEWKTVLHINQDEVIRCEKLLEQV